MGGTPATESTQTLDVLHRQLEELRAEAQRRTRDLRLLNDLALAAGQMLDLQAILDLALGTVVDRLGMEAGNIFLFDPETERYELRAWRGLHDAQIEEIYHRREDPAVDLVGHVVHSAETLFVPDMAADPRFQRGVWAEVKERSFVKMPLCSKGKVVGAMGLVSYAGHRLTACELEIVQAVGHEIGIAIDNAVLFAESRRSEKEAITLNRLLTRVSASLELRDVVEAVAEGTREVLSADIGMVGLGDLERQLLTIKACSGARTPFKRIAVPLDSAPGLLLKKGLPVVLDGWQAGALAGPLVEWLSAEGVLSFLGVPICRGSQLFGMLAALKRQRHRFAKAEIALLNRLASQVVIAIENAHLYSQVRHVAILEERGRLARELHDSLAQQLGYLSLQAALTVEQLDKCDLVRAKSGLEEIRQVTQAAYTDVREAICDLRTTGVSAATLVPMLRECLAEYAAHYGIKGEIILDDGLHLQLADDIAVQVTRILQEALANARKHAAATHVWVRIERRAANWYIVVEDDGRGFDLDEQTAADRRCFGLQTMRERARSVGGKLNIESHLGQGTCVTLILPQAAV